MKTERKELIARLNEYASTNLAPALMNEAATMLEADAVPQEPVAYLCDDGDGHFDVLSDKACKQCFPVYAAPQQRPRLTDAEILTLWAQTYVERGTSGIEFARAIEKKVRGEA